jgi:hypothetical protein
MIARELFVKLGFDIDEAEFSRFIKMSDNLKSRLTGLKSYVGSKLSYVKEAIQPKLKESKQVKQIEAIQPKLKESKQVKQIEAIQPKLKESKQVKQIEAIQPKQVKAPSYKFAALGSQEKQPAINNTFAKKFAQAKAYADELKALTPAERSEIKLLNKLESDEIKERLREVKTRQKERRKASLAKVGTLANKVAVISAAATGIFALNTRSTLKDVEQFKKTGTTDSGNTFSKDQVKTVDNFNRSFNSLKYSIKDVRNSLVIDLLPSLNEVIIKFKDWIEKNKEAIKTKFDRLIKGVSKAFDFLLPILERLSNILNAIVESTIGWENLIAAIVGIGLVAWIAGVITKVWALVAAFTALIANPVVLTITAITAALILLTDEIYLTTQGGDTLITRFFGADAIDKFKAKLDSIIDSFKNMWSWITKTTDAMSNLISEQFNKISFKNILPDFSSIGEMVGNREINVPVGGKLINMKDMLPKYNPQEAFGNSNSVMNTTNRNNKVLNQRNSFNINVTTPVGTSQEQSRIIVDLVQKELQKTFDYENEKALIAVGVT